MRSIAAAHRSQKSSKELSCVVKRGKSDPQRPSRALRGLEDYFWYTSMDGVCRLATSSGAVPEIPRQVIDYTFDPSDFALDPYPSTFPKGEPWPPTKAEHLLLPIGAAGEDCVGNRCYTKDICTDPKCGHTFAQWKRATRNWQEYFDLQKTKNRGIGAYTNVAFKKGDVLGWYAGEIVPTGFYENNDYLMEMPVGHADWPKSSSDCESISGRGADSGYASSDTSVPNEEETVMIDASRKGNWTRFINHSCNPYCEFRMRRVGNTRIMVVQAIKSIPVGVELTVAYGEDYYGPATRKICCCGTKRCVSRLRKRSADLLPAEKKRVKKCKRLTAPKE